MQYARHLAAANMHSSVKGPMDLLRMPTQRNESRIDADRTARIELAWEATRACQEACLKM